MKSVTLPVSYFLIFIASAALLVYGGLLWQMDRAQKAVARADTSEALAIYTRLETLFHLVPGLPRVLQREYQEASYNQIAILHGQRNYDESLRKLEQLPAYLPSAAETGEYSFWMGNLLFHQAARAEDPETSVNALKSALAEYQRGLAAQPDDWDLKYNYELIRTIFSQRERDKQKEGQKVKSILDKMRPTEPSRQEVAPEKRG
jgi:hypothetical protein